MYSSKVESLLSEGSKLYGGKDYDGASEKYAEACEEFNSENDKDDGDLLFLYGKSLFQSAVSNNEVFGGGQASSSVAKEGQEAQEKEEDGDGNFQFADDAPLAEEDDEEGPVAEEEDEEEEEEEADDDDDDEKDEAGDGEVEQTDFEVAWEILDLTRSIFESQLNELSDKNNDKLPTPYLSSDNETTPNEIIILTKKLSETYDLLGEVSLESENFNQSAIDLEKCLQLRQKLYNPENSSLISESHYKLSLALEFCVEDPELKGRAIKHLKEAIRMVGAKNDSLDEKKRKENEELVQDLQIKLDELEKDQQPEIDEEKLEILKGILGQSTGSGNKAPTASAVNDLTSVIKKKKVAPVVNDLSSMVKKRKVPSKERESKKSKK